MSDQREADGVAVCRAYGIIKGRSVKVKAHKKKPFAETVKMLEMLRLTAPLKGFDDVTVSEGHGGF